MSERKEQLGLDEVLEAFMASTPGPNKNSLSEWIAMYPQYSRELMDLAAHWSLTTWMPTDEATTEEESRMTLQGISTVQDVLHRKQRKNERVVENAPIIGLFEECKKKRLTRSQFVEATELSASLLTMLDRRLCDFSSIHARVIDKISQALDQSFANIASYLNNESTFAVAAHRKSGKSSKLALKQNFLDAVRADSQIKEEWRQKWLALASDTGSVTRHKD
jgi:transcriptional regulator with XRE-family HTH domain